MPLDYFAKYFTAKSTEASQRLIQQRIRALQVFLDFIDGHPVLSKDPVYQKFISSDSSWVQYMQIHMSLMKDYCRTMPNAISKCCFLLRLLQPGPQRLQQKGILAPADTGES